MKYFICALGRINLGIPAEQTERIIPSERIQANVYETGNQETFISLPLLFKQKDTAVPHGVVLKGACTVKTVLLTPRIDMDLEIPEENIHRLPDAFVGRFRYFRGACFSGQNLILILDSQKLMEGMR